MIHKDITIIDLGSDNWTRLMRLPKELAAESLGGRSLRVLVVIYRGLKCLKAVDFAAGRTVEIEWLGTSRLEQLAQQTGYPVVIALEETALARVCEHAQRDLDFRDDMVKQWLGFLKGVSREWRRTIFSYPPGPAIIPVIPYGAIEAAAHALIPNNSLLLFAVTERGKVWTSAVVGWRDGDFWLLTSLDTLGMEEADISDGALDAAVEMLSARFSGKVRALVIERSEMARVLNGRFPIVDILLGLNSTDIRLSRMPKRWKVIALATAGAASIRSLLKFSK